MEFNRKELIEKFYDIKFENNVLWITRKGSDKQHAVPRSPDDRIILTCNEVIKETSDEYLKKLEGEGKIVITNPLELYTMFSDLSDDEIHLLLYGYSIRTKKYLDAVIKNIGLLETKAGYKEEKFEIERQYNIWPNLTGSGYVDVGRLSDGRYIAQFSYRTDIDDYIIEKYYFNHFPSRKDIITAKLVDDVKSYFKFGNKEIFHCWECGVEKHWLDIQASSLEERFERLKEKYCGC